jgi:inner membrane protein
MVCERASGTERMSVLRDMATAVTHVFLPLVLGKAFARERLPWRFWICAIGCSVLPDVDVLSLSLGLPYGSIFGHRGFSHSLSFAFLLSMVIIFGLFKEDSKFFNLRWSLFFFLLTSSHGVLDALTNGGWGVAFFSPIDTTRYFFPWTPLRVSPLGLSGFFSPWGKEVIWSEMIWIWTPSILLFMVVRVGRKIFSKTS